MSLETNTNQAHNNILNDAQKIEFRFDHFCFETDDKQGIILNYATLPPLMKNMGCKNVIDKIVAFAALHMQLRNRKTFVMHLFCKGMKLKDMPTMKTFMIHFAKVFKVTYPTELQICYVIGAPTIFAAIYELFKSILPKESRDKIVIQELDSVSN